jgi:Holliday junction resolvase
MSRAEREKGARGEREVATILRRNSLPAVRTPNSGGLHVKGDLTGVPGYHFEIKRQETLRLPAWLRQAADECSDETVPVVVWRTNRSDWFAAIPLTDLARLLDLARLAG